MSAEPQSTSPQSPCFQHVKHRPPSCGTFYTCSPSTPPVQFYQNSCCSTATFRTPPSSLSGHQTYFVPAFPSQISSSELNYSQTSLGHHSIKARYPDPYSDNPFLPLRELRRLRSNELLAPATPPISPPLLPTPLTASPSPFGSLRGTRKPPPSLDEKQTRTSIFTVKPTTSGAAPLCDTSATDLADPVDVPKDLLIVDAFGVSELPDPNTGVLPPTPLYNLLPVDFPPISPLSTILQHRSFHTQSLDGAVTQVMSPDPSPSERDFHSKLERSRTASSDTGSALRTLFGLRLSEIGSHSVGVCESPGEDEIEGFAWGIEEQNVQVDASRRIEFGESVGQSGTNTVESQILVDRDKRPTNELASVPWVNVSATSLPSTRKRPPPIRVENQGQRLTAVQIVTASPRDVDQENVELKTSVQWGSVPAISSTGEVDGVASPRSLKLSDASGFSLSLFPPTPTTPIFQQTWIGENYRGQHGNQSPAAPHFSLGQQGLGSPTRSAANLGVQLDSSLAPRIQPSPVRRTTYSGSASTPVRRSTIQIGRRQPSELSRTSDHLGALLTRASSDLPRPQQMSTALTTPPRQATHVEPSMVLQQAHGTQVEPGCHFFPTGRPRSDTGSSDSESVYSQESENDTAPFYSDEGASMSVSVAATALREQEGQHISGQPQPASMRTTTPSSGCYHSFVSRPSSTSKASPEPVDPNGSKQEVNENGLPLSESVAAIPGMPPTRKPVPQIDTASIMSGKVVSETSLSLSQPTLSQASSKAASFNTLPSRLKRKTTKRKPNRLVISHPHLNDESMLGAQVVSKRESVVSPLLLGPKLTHSKSVGSLRDVLLSGNPKHGSHARSKPNTLTKKSHKKQPRPPFEKYKMPSEEQLKLASDMHVLDEHGRQVRFGDIFEGQKTAICFIRHFWCPLCQDYMSSIVHLTEPSLIQKAGVKLVIIGNGSPVMIKAYRDDIFHCSYEMYTDPSRQVYKALGMTLRTSDRGDDSEKGSYVKHGTFTGTMMGLKNALKMPLANAGDIKKLGGEFILGPGLTCSFTSRMHTTRSHTPIRDLLQAAGVETNPWATDLSILQCGAEQARWMDAQNEDLDNMIRRGLRASCSEKHCKMGPGSDLKIGELNLSEFRRLLEHLKSEVSELRSKQQPLTGGASYESEVMGRRRVELDHLSAVRQSRSASGAREAHRNGR